MSGTKNERFVAVIDNEQSMREALESLLRSAGYRAEGFASADALLCCAYLDAIDCLVLDIGLPGMDGFQLQQRLCILNVRTPIIFISATADSQASRLEQAMQAGAVAFLRKPFAAQALLDAVEAALLA
jgi:FixJ family two-component response regulator